MLTIDISRQAARFLKKVHPKHARQIARKLLDLQQNPTPHDSIQLKGKNSHYRRTDVGEYRVVYYVNNDTLYIILIAKRNDNEVYKILNRH